MTHFKTDINDLTEAVTLLDNDTDVECWSIAKITNDQHSLSPEGKGFGVSVWNQTATVFEKAGRQRTLVEAAQSALQRLKRRITGEIDA